MEEAGFYLRQQLPEKLRKHQFKELLPEEKRLPAPVNEYLEMETMKAFGYTVGQWREESGDARARMMAHEIHRGMRDAYLSESIQSTPGGPPAEAVRKKQAPWETVKNLYNLK